MMDKRVAEEIAALKRMAAFHKETEPAPEPAPNHWYISPRDQFYFSQQQLILSKNHFFRVKIG